VAHPQALTLLFARHIPDPKPDHPLPLANFGCRLMRRAFVCFSRRGGTVLIEMD
jgi:hypothetical protein